jgi:hypothetical protein
MRRYGRSPLPQFITASLFDNRLASDSRYKKDADWFRSWYILDQNAVPPRYELRNPAHISDTETWSNWRAANPVLMRTFDGLAFDSSFCEDLLVGRSIQDWELKAAMSIEGGDTSHMLWLHRVFDGSVRDDDEVACGSSVTAPSSHQIKFAV